MQLLIYLTLIYAAVLVGALALALIAIASLLWWTSLLLRDTRTALTAVRDHTAPLPAQLGAVKENVDGAHTTLASARDRVRRLGERLIATGERAGLFAEP